MAVDSLDIEDKLKRGGLDVIVSRFDHVEEYLMLYGLPLNSDMNKLKVKIEESIKPFVKDILEVKPCVHKDEHGQDYFKGNLNGNWFLKVVPKKNAQIPNYIVVGNRVQACAKAVYIKKVGEKLEMCADCFSTSHHKRSPECEGPVRWLDYCQSFRDYWDAKSLEIEGEDAGDGGDDEVGDNRFVALNKTLFTDLRKAELQRDAFEEEIAQQENLTVVCQELKNSVQVNEAKIKEFEEVNSALKLDLEASQKRNEELEGEVAGLMDSTLRRMSLSSVVPVEISIPEDSGKGEGNDGETVGEQVEGGGDEDDEKVEEGGDVEVVEEEGATGGVADNIQEDALKNLQDVSEVDSDDSKSVSIESSFNGFGSDLSSENQNSQKLEEVVSDAGDFLRRKRGGESPGDQGRDKRLKGAHPEIGYNILVETMTGNHKYLVKSKKNVKKLSDCFYYLQNSENKVIAYDLKNANWDYIDEGEVFEPVDGEAVRVSRFYSLL